MSRRLEPIGKVTWSDESYGATKGCGYRFANRPPSTPLKCAETEVLLRDKYIGSIDRFRYKPGWRFADEIVIKFDEES